MLNTKEYEIRKADLKSLIEKLKHLSEPQLLYVAGAVDFANLMSAHDDSLTERSKEDESCNYDSER